MQTQNSLQELKQRINDKVNSLQQQAHLQQTRLEKLIEKQSQFDFEAIEKFLKLKGLVINRIITSRFADTDSGQLLTQEMIDSAQLVFDFYVDATNFKTIKRMIFKGYSKGGSSLNHDRMIAKENQFIELFEKQFPNLRCSTNSYCFEDKSSDEKYMISFTLRTKN